MNTRNTLIILVTLILVGGLAWYGYARKGSVKDTNFDGVIDGRDVQNATNTPGSNNTGGSGSPVVLNANVRLSTPKAGDTISSPLIIKGEARGWYFEGSFPVKLLGPNGQVLAEGPATAEGNWMTTEFVPFTATLNYSSDVEGTGKLVLSKDNPSGLPQNDASVSIPVIIKKTNTTAVKVYFASGDGTDCRETRAVTHYVPKTTAVALAAINELLKGPTSAETAQGLRTSLPTSGVKVQKLEIKNGTAYVDFNSALELGVGGSCRVASINSQIVSTLKQFSTVKNVVISINGRTEDILQP